MPRACTRRASCRDGGTLQIGIGSLGEAVAQALVLRQRDNDAFRTLLSRLGYDPARDAAVHAGKFDVGLYGCSELFVEGMLDLYRAGILKREVDGIVLHAGFFLGSRGFYKALREMPRDVVKKFGMTAIALRQRALSRRGQQAARADKGALPQRRHDGDRARRRDLRRPRRRPHRQRRRRAI